MSEHARQISNERYNTGKSTEMGGRGGVGHTSTCRSRGGGPLAGGRSVGTAGAYWGGWALGGSKGAGPLGVRRGSGRTPALARQAPFRDGAGSVPLPRETCLLFQAANPAHQALVSLRKKDVEARSSAHKGPCQTWRLCFEDKDVETRSEGGSPAD
jgi:hypothetical protein